MRTFPALVAAAVALTLGMLALSRTRSQVTTNSTASNRTRDVLDSVSTGWIEPLAGNLPILAVVGLVTVGGGVLVAASRGR